jgi:hypothetical protein
MTIWILTVLFLASLAGLGYRQGAIRVGFSLIGILLGGLLSAPLGHLIKPVVAAVGVKNPALLWLIPPTIIFILVLTLAKVGGLFVHKKVEVFYKYKAGELRLALWERLNQRVGLCLGFLNATAYIILLSLMLYMVSYWTVQASTENDPTMVRLFNRLGKDLETTGMSKIVHNVDHTSKNYYDAADVAGLLYQTPLLEARLSRYPGILGLAERPEFQDLASDTQFAEMRQRRATIMEMLNYPKVQGILSNPDALKGIETSVLPNLQDLRSFLETGKSEKYSEELLGRWNFSLTGTVGIFRREKPNTPQRQIADLRRTMAASFGKAVLVATPENQIILKGTPQNFQLQGEWKGSNGKYDITGTIDGKPIHLVAELHGSRLEITGTGFVGLAFERED